MVTRLGCLRGVSALTRLALAVEIGDWHRFTGKTIGSLTAAPNRACWGSRGVLLEPIPHFRIP